MAGPDIFLSSDAKTLLGHKRILMFGDSNMRALYKDLLWLLNYNKLLSENQLKIKLEKSFAFDTLLKKSALTQARTFQESRQFNRLNVYIKFTFMTRCFNEIIETVLMDIYKKVIPAPDIIVMNSCLWDLARWGPNGVEEYEVNLQKLTIQMKACLPASCQVIWLTTLPLSPDCKGGFLKPVDFLQSLFPFNIMEANLFARDLFVYFGYDVLDLHYHMRWHVARQVADGVHWNPEGMRFITNLLLTHLSLLLGVPLPGRAPRLAMQHLRQQEAALRLLTPQVEAASTGNDRIEGDQAASTSVQMPTNYQV